MRSIYGIFTVLVALCGGMHAVRSQDCDGDGRPDHLEVRPSLSFTEPEIHSVGNRPTTLASGDLDGDGWPDLVVTNTYSNSLSLLFNAPGLKGSTFESDVQICVGIDPRGVAIGHVDGDGNPDIVCGSEGRFTDLPDDTRPRSTVILGRGRRRFEPNCTSPCLGLLPEVCREGDFPAIDRSADAVRTLVLFDLDGDNDVDILHGIRDPEAAVTALFGSGDGGFSLPFWMHTESLSEARYIAVGDVDGDGSPDVVTAGGEILRGPFLPGENLPFPVGRIATIDNDQRGVALGDVNGDGIADAIFARTNTVLAGPGAGVILVYTGDGAGGWNAVDQPALVDLPDLLEGLATEDLDGDGDIDLVVTHQSFDDVAAGIRVLAGDGQGRFEPGPFVPFRERRPRWIITEDFDQDGRQDIAVALDDPLRFVDEIAVMFNRSEAAPSDSNRNGVVDECEFFRGDTDRDRRITISDAISVLRYLFLGASAPPCLEAADYEDDGEVVLSDAISILLFLFRAGPPPAPPAPRPDGSCEWPEEWIDQSGLLDCDPPCP